MYHGLCVEVTFDKITRILQPDMTKKILNQGEFLRGNDVMTGLDQCGDSMEW